MNPRYALLYVINFIALYNICAAQDSTYEKEVIAIHPRIGITTNWHSPNFTSFSGIAECGKLTEGFSTGLSTSLSVEYPILSWSHLSFGIGYISRNGDLSSSFSYPERDPNTNKLVNREYESQLEALISYLEFQPEIRMELPFTLFYKPLRLSAAFRYAYPIDNYFTQIEKIVAPSDLVFVIDGKRTKERQIASGNIKTITKNNYGISIGIENLLKTGQSTFLTQQIIFDYNLTDIATDVNWKFFTLRFELGYRFSIERNEAVPLPEIPLAEHKAEPKPEPRPVIVEKKEAVVEPDPDLSCKIQSLDGVINTGEEFVASLPLVNCVFFDRNSATVRDYYLLSADNSENRFYGNPIDLHKCILSNIADILSRNPKATLILSGATSGKINEPEGIELAKKRAEAVQNVFVNMGIDKKRVSVNFDVMPQNPSNQEYPEGIEENQRVDIIVRNAPLQEYVALRKFSEFRGLLYNEVNFQHVPNSTELKLQTNLTDSIINPINNGTYAFNVIKRLDEEDTEIDALITLTLSDRKHKASNVQKFPLDKYGIEPVELNLASFNAIIRFDYNSSRLSEETKGLLRQMSEFLPTGSTIIIYGSTDALGTEKRNKALAIERAKVTEDYIRSVSGKKFSIELQSNDEKFEEDTPQGRFLNRSIRVRVRNK